MYIDKQLPRPINLTLDFGRPRFGSPLALYLAFKEIWRSKGRFFLVSLVIALITVLVLFIAGLAEGLGAGNREYLEKLNADLILYQDGVELSIPSSRFSRFKLNDVKRVAGVKDVGPISFSNSAIVFENGREPLKISLIGVEPGLPGEPPAYQGRGLAGRRDNEAVIDRNVALRTNLKVGDTLTLKSIQGTTEKYYTLKVVGLSDGRQYSIQPSVFVPDLTWDRVRPQDTPAGSRSDVIFNLMAVQLDNPKNLEVVTERLKNQVDKIQVTDRQTAYQNTPGYRAQQSTLNTQRFFTLLIGVLVIGGFFQIQTLQKVAQIGVLKAIGASNLTVAVAFILQIVAVTILGVAIGGLGTLMLSLSFPPTVPIVFTLNSVALAIASLLLIGPLGGLVSLRILLKVEPLTALSLA